MKASNAFWHSRLQEKMPETLAKEIDVFETEIELRKQGKLDEKVFAETRLRRGAYGQRYDNGQRHDGAKTQQLPFPSGELTKGPSTLWDAPGMLRIKIPFGGINAEQMEVVAELAEEYSDGIAHVTTRQDFQLHFIHIDDTPSIMRRLAAVGITTREACGNSVRNLTACPFAGVCPDETFDVTPYAKALTYFLLGHPDCQDFGRKFKIAFSGCPDKACGLVKMHDMGFIALQREGKRGFAVYAGGGLGSVPFEAKLFSEFVPEEELLPLTQAVARVFARLGEKKNRNRARIKFLVKNLGIEEFRRLVLEERAVLPPDSRWTEYLEGIPGYDEEPLKPPSTLDGASLPEGFDLWRQTNVYRQKQAGYGTVSITLPLGDITADQLRGLADVARRFVKETVRTTVEQNMVLRWMSEADLPEVFSKLHSLGLAQAGAGTIVDVVSCPGTDTCKLGISSSRGLGGELRQRLLAKNFVMEEAIQKLHIKVSGCFNSCGQHHIADLGFYGVSRHIDNRTVPHFQVVLGGQWENNGGSYGLAVGAVPSKRIPEVVDRLTGEYLKRRTKGEEFRDFVNRIGKVAIKNLLDDLTAVPPYAQEPSFYSDWADPREYTTGDMGIGECAGEVISRVTFGLTAAERKVFEAQVLLDQGQAQSAADLAFSAMLDAARALVQEFHYDVSQETPDVVAEFRKYFYDTQLFFDRFTGGKFAQYFLAAYEHLGKPATSEDAHQLIEETQLFIEACHGCYGKMQAGKK